MAEKGYEFAEVNSSVEPLPGGPKLVKVIFDVQEGPKVKIRTINFDGNTAVSDGTLKRQMKETKEHWFLSLITGARHLPGSEVRGRRRQDRRVLPQPRLRPGARRPARAEDARGQRGQGRRAGSSSTCRSTEGQRYKVGEFSFDGNNVIKSEVLRPLFKLKPGDFYSEKRIRNGLTSRRRSTAAAATSSSPASRTWSSRTRRPGPARRPGRAHRQRHDADDRKASSTSSTASPSPATPRRATTSSAARCGWSRAASSTPRRSSTASSASISSATSRTLEEQGGQGIDVQKTPNAKNEGRRHAEAGRAEPQPADLRRRRLAVRGLLRPAVVPDRQLPRPRRDAHAVGADRLARARTTSSRSPSRSCSTARSPAAFDIYKRTLRYIDQFTQESTGGNLSTGFPVANFSRMFFTYSYERVRVTELNPFYYTQGIAAQNPFLADSLLLGAGRQAHDQQGDARASSTTRSTTRSSRPRGTAHHAPASTWPAPAATPTSSSRASRRCS